jgi:ATP-dependent helicase/nuclease subunit A
VLDGVEEDAYPLSSVVEKREDTSPVTTEAESRRNDYLPAFYTGEAADESARRGTATHVFMQFCNLEVLAESGAAAELERLCANDFISESDKSRVRINEIEAFIRSELFTAMKSAKEIYRELRFNLRLDAKHFAEDEERRKALEGERILVQGVIDCIIVDKDGGIRLVDYKTDRLTKAELQDPELAGAKLLERHSLQLSYYAMATEQIFGKRPDSAEIYSLPLGDTVKCDL